MFPNVDTRDAAAVADRIRALFRLTDLSVDLTFFDCVFAEIGSMFFGDFGDFLPIDLRYHDYQHTLQATLCMAEILVGRHQAGVKPAYSWRDCELGMAAILFHDVGYLKTHSDGGGTGAKFTYTHVLRSAAVAASQLPRYGVTPAEAQVVLGAIRCTGPTAKVDEQNYHHESDLLLGCCVATADYLGQMAASDYPDELEILFNEFQESDDYQGIPAADRMFKSAPDLIKRTPFFWKKFVLPKLQGELRGVYMFLAQPHPDGPNPYLDAIEHNMVLIKQRGESVALPPLTA
jgi:hypothetical protein